METTGSRPRFNMHSGGHRHSGTNKDWMSRATRFARHHAPWLIGALALLWFIVRVGPRPSRAAYPCQQFTLVTIGGFLGWLAGIAGLGVLARRAWTLRGRQGILTGVVFASALGVWMLLGMPAGTLGAAAPPPPWTPTDPPNTPMGVAKGINPGRVAWAHHPDAATWNGNTGTWWDPANNNQAALDAITRSSLRALTGEDSEVAAWNSLFIDFNQRRGVGARGHNPGELVAVKINQNPARDGNTGNGTPDPNQIVGHPFLIISLIRSLTNAGVPEDDIMIYDASRYIADSVYVPIKNVFPDVRIMQEKAGPGREVATWTANAVAYPDTPPSTVNMTSLATQIVNTPYLINMAIMKTHGADIPTLCGKNHWGTTPFGRDHYWINGDRPMGSYSPVVSHFGSKYLGGKTLLYMIDTIYSANGSDSGPSRWNIAPFNGGWPNSLFVSQDPVAIDSVGFDFANANWGLPHNTDNFLHESALANNPPSGTNYSPDGVRLASLGVHEHWNSVANKQYSRNLNPATGTGIELVYVNVKNCTHPSCGPEDPTDTGGDVDTDVDTGTNNDTGADTDTGTGTIANRYEAEDSVFVNANLGQDAAASGGEYGDGNEGANFTWIVTATGGSATLSFAIRALDRVMGVYVNGVKVGIVTTSTDRPVWAVHSVEATLVAGENTVELRDTEGTAEPDVDYLEVITVAPQDTDTGPNPDSDVDLDSDSVSDTEFDFDSDGVPDTEFDFDSDGTPDDDPMADVSDTTADEGCGCTVISANAPWTLLQLLFR